MPAATLSDVCNVCTYQPVIQSRVPKYNIYNDLVLHCRTNRSLPYPLLRRSYRCDVEENYRIYNPLHNHCRNVLAHFIKHRDLNYTELVIMYRQIKDHERLEPFLALFSLIFQRVSLGLVPAHVLETIRDYILGRSYDLDPNVPRSLEDALGRFMSDRGRFFADTDLEDVEEEDASLVLEND